jgi:hypothetical protein
MRHLIIGILLLSFLAPVSAQNKNPEDEFGNWNAWINTLVFSPTWKLDTDFHLRTWNFGKDPFNLILRGGLAFVAKPWLELSAGYGYFEFYPYGGEDGWKASSKEHRLYQQVFAKHKFKGFSFNHRYRLEERMIQTPAEKHIRRSRYRFFVSHPVASKLYTWASYEHFWTMSDWKFDQGRLHLGFGHPIAKNAKLELAYLRHFVKNDLEYNRLQVNLITSLRLKQAENQGK